MLVACGPSRKKHAAVPGRTASPDRSDLALELTFGNQKHLSSYAMDRLDVGRHLCASTWVRMVIIAPRELGQAASRLAREKSAQGKCAVMFELRQSPRIHPIS